MSTVNPQNVQWTKCLWAHRRPNPEAGRFSVQVPWHSWNWASKGAGKGAAFAEQHMYNVAPPLPWLYLLSASIPHDKPERWHWVSKNRWSTPRKIAISSHTFLWIYSEILQTYRGESVLFPVTKPKWPQNPLHCWLSVFSEDLGPPPTTTESWHSASTLDLLTISFPLSFQQALEENKNDGRRGKLKL